MASKQGQGWRSVGLQRLALFAFAAAFVLLFVGLAIAEGLGDPSVPSGDVAIVEGAPDDSGTITEADFQHALAQAAASAGVKPVPKPGDNQYEEMKESALGELLNFIWIEGQGEEMGIAVTPKEVSKELEKVKKQSFKTEAEYQEFLKTSHLTQADVDKRIQLQILSKEIQEQLGESAPVPSSGEIEDYYEAAKSSQFTQPETREIRLVLNEDKKKVEEAKAKLEKDNSASSWEKVAKQYSTDPTSKKKGGLQASATEESLGPLGPVVFSAPTGQVEGPVQGGRPGYTVFEVVKATPEKVQSLEEAKPQISAKLAEQGKQEAFQAFILDFSARWRSRTFCAADFKTKQCANFKIEERPAEAEPGCYEASPKGGPPKACPAPVQQVKPALPGSVSVLTPGGERLPQLPRPAGAEPAPESSGLTGVPSESQGE